MGARRFGPRDNHFLQEDRLAGALGNMGLGQDPLTSNRYSLAGGNPTSFVEVDGHWSIGDLFGGGSKDGNPIDTIKKKGKDFFDKAKRTVKSGIDKVASATKGPREDLAKSAKETGVVDVVNEVGGQLGENMDKITRGVSKAGESIGDFAEDTIENGAERLSKWSKGGKSAIKKAGRSVARWGGDGGLGDAIEDKIRDAGHAVGSSDFLKKAGTTLDRVSTGVDLVSGFASQLGADWDRKDMGLGEKLGRAVGRAGIETLAGELGGKAGAWAGAAFCGALGAATGGLAIAACAVAGGVAGGLAGSIGGDYVADKAIGED
jgi:hypothetical protein